MLIHGVILLIIGTLELLLGLYFVIRRPAGEAVRWYILFVFSVATWVFANASGALRSSDLQIVRISFEFAYIAGGFIAAAFVLFSYSFPFPRRAITFSFVAAIFLPAVVNIFVALLTNTYIPSVWETNGTIKTGLSTPLLLFAVYFVTYWTWGMLNLTRAYRRADGIHRWQLQYLLYGIIVSSVFAITFDIILPLLPSVTFPGLNWVGSEFSIVWLGFTSYVLLRHRLVKS